MRSREGPGQAGTEGCGRGCHELFTQQPPLGVVSGQLPESPLQSLSKEPQLLVRLGQLQLGLQWEGLGWGCSQAEGILFQAEIQASPPTKFSLGLLFPGDPKHKPSWSYP